MACLLALALAVFTCTGLIHGSGEGESEPSDRFVSSLVQHLNSAPGRTYLYEEGTLISAQRRGEHVYDVEANVRAVDPSDAQRYKLLTCRGQLVEDEFAHPPKFIVGESSGCHETEAAIVTAAPILIDADFQSVESDDDEGMTEAAEAMAVQRAVHLDHEVLPTNEATSGEQFVAVRRERGPGGACAGCGSLVDPAAPGVDDLARLALRHLDRHDPEHAHRLARIHTVERQVQVVNGVRYILILDVDYDNCSLGNLEGCAETKTCKVSVLEKPWIKLPNGSKFRAIISNNCTDEYLFGDNGEVLPTISEGTDSNENRDNEININFNPDDNGRYGVSLPPRPTPDYDAIANSGSADDILKVIHSTQLQANMPPRERELTPEEMKHLEEQIIPTANIDTTIALEQKIYNTEPTVTAKITSDQLAVLPKQSSLSTDQQKALDGLIDYLSFDLVSSNTRSVRQTRNVDKADDPYVQTLGNLLVNTLNNFDVRIKNRVLQQVLTADEETKAGRHIFYIRAKVAFPDTNDETHNSTVKVCNAMFDASIMDAPRVLKSFCNESSPRKRHSRKLGGREKVDVNNPEILLLINQALQKIESESTYDRKLKVMNVLSADKHVASGTLTRLSLEIGLTDCLKSSTADISKCNLRMDRASTICKIHSLRQPWLKSNKITFECVDAPMPSSQNKSIKAGDALESDVNDPEILKLALESLQKFELTSDNTNRRKIVQIHSATTQVVSGYLTKISYDVALTKCAKGDTAADLQSCELLENTPRQRCQAEIWNRPWLKDGKRIEVICNNVNDVINDAKEKSHRVKRQLVGGSTIQNPDKFNDAVKESLQKLEQLTQSQYKQKVVKVTKVTTQVVSGSLTKIDFDVAYTKCLSNELTTSIDDCELLEDRPVRHCHSEIWNRPWLGKDGKQITVTCNDNSSKRTKRDTCGVPGGVCSVDVSTHHIQLAQESLQQLEQLTDSEYKQKVLNITSVTSQVVAGTKTKIDFHAAYTKCLRNDLKKNVDSECELLTDKPTRICHSEIWERPWLTKDAKIITVNCDDSKKRDKRGFYEDASDKDFLGYRMNDSDRKKRDVGLNDVVVAEKAVDILNSRLFEGNLLKFVKITSIKRDMNNALLHIHFEVGSTTCSLRDMVRECDLMEDHPHKQCHAKVWRRRPRSSLPNGEISVYCDADLPEHLRIIPDENFIENKSVDKLENRKLAQLALEKLTDTSYKMKVMKILTVSDNENETGKSIVFLGAFTNCTIDVPIERFSECKVLKKKIIRLCQAEVWAQENLFTIRCDNFGKAKRSSSPDFPTRVDHNDELYRLLAKDSLARLELASDSSSRQKVVRVTSAEILPGDVRRIAFEAAYTVCSKYEKVKDVDTCEPLPNPPHRYCSAQIWRRDWLKRGFAIDVDCQGRDGIKSADYDTALQLAELSLKHIEAKYLHPNKQNVVRIVSFDRKVTLGIHYRMKFEVGYTDCLVFDDPSGCNFTTEKGPNRICKSNMWVRPQSDGAPNIRVICELDSDAIPDDILLQLQAERLFHRFLVENQRDYVDDKSELAKRFNIFKDNVKRIHELNTRERGTAKYGVTRFADMTYDEFSKKRGGLRPDLRNENAVPMPQAVIKKNFTLPESFDWRTKGAVTQVKDQGQCGSCWAFSVTGNIEGQYQIAVGELLSFSEQELVDCDSLDEGCNGGLPDNAYRAIEQLGGLEEEKAYPYDAEDEKCKYDPARVAVQITGAVNISNNETTMAEWLVQNGPISIGINANGMQFYMGGVSHPWKMLCNPKNLDHGVLIVGYGVKSYPLFHKTLPYWIVKNSWGPSWGESGYYRVFRGDGTCGLNTMASSAVVN